MRYKAFLVVGGAGFVGSHVVDALIHNGAEKVVAVDNMHLGNLENLSEAANSNKLTVYREDARYLSALDNIIGREQPEVVYNLAVKCLPYGFVDPEGSFMTGVEIAQNLAVLLRKRRFNRLVHFSSSEAYGTAKTVPMNENHPLDPTTPYGAGKAAADLLLLSYYKLFNLEINIIRPFNLYGPRQNMEAYAAVIPVTINRILNCERPIIEGDGTQTRDFTYVLDVANIAVKIVDYDETVGRIVNIGQGCEFSIKSVVYQICQKLNYPVDKIMFKSQRPSDVRRLYSDISLAKRLVNYTPKTKFSDGIDLTIKWFKDRLSNHSVTREVLKIVGSESG